MYNLGHIKNGTKRIIIFSPLKPIQILQSHGPMGSPSTGRRCLRITEAGRFPTKIDVTAWKEEAPPPELHLSCTGSNGIGSLCMITKTFFPDSLFIHTIRSSNDSQLQEDHRGRIWCHSSMCGTHCIWCQGDLASGWQSTNNKQPCDWGERGRFNE